MSEGSITNGLREGKWHFFYDTGRICKEISFHKGVEDGQWKMWHENGNLYLVQCKENGSTVGVCSEYYENGQIKEVGEYINESYYPLDFWTEAGEQLLKRGTGKKIEKFGYLELDVVEQYYQEGRFVREEKVSSAKYNNFKP